MTSCSVTRNISADPDRVWQLLRDFGDVHWIPVISHVDVDGNGPGMRRFLSDGQSDPVVERLVALDDEARRLRYTIDENNPLPVSRYEADATVSPTADGASITWQVDFDAADDAEATAAIEMIYDVMAGWLADAANA